MSFLRGTGRPSIPFFCLCSDVLSFLGLCEGSDFLALVGATCCSPLDLGLRDHQIRSDGRIDSHTSAMCCGRPSGRWPILHPPALVAPPVVFVTHGTSVAAATAAAAVRVS